MLRRIAWWLRHRLRPERVAEEIEDDIRTHIELDAERLRGEGIAPEEALRRARERFGDLERIREQMLAVAGGAPAPGSTVGRGRRSRTERLALDLRHALRSLRATAGPTLLVVATLATAVAVLTLTLAVADTVFRGAGGVSDPSQIVTVHTFFRELPEGTKEQPLSPVVVTHLLDSDAAEAVAAFKSGYFNLSGHGRPRRLDGMLTTPGLFDVAGVHPLLGPGFADVRTGEERVVVLSWGLWQELGAEPGLLGSSLELNAEPYEIVGIMPAGFAFPSGEDVPATFRFPHHPDVWVPYAVPDRGPGDLGVVARLRAGVSATAFQGELDAALRAVEKEYAEQFQGRTLPFTLRSVPLREQATGAIRPALVVLLLAATLVVLVAMGNVTGVGVARGEARAGELAVRMALGSGRRGVAGLIAAESLLIAMLTASAGLGLAALLAEVVRRTAPEGMPGVDQLHLSLPLVAASLAVSLAGASCLALGTAARVRRWRLGDVLRGTRDAGSRGARRTGLVLVAVELGATLVLLSGSAALVRSVFHLLSADPGFRAPQVLTAEITLPEARYPDAARARSVQRAEPAEGADPSVPRFQRALAERISQAPGVVAAAVGRPIPFGGAQESTVYWIDGREAPESLELVDYTAVTEGYFRALGIPLLQGRGFTAADRHDSEPVVVVSASLAAQFPAGQALGRRMKLGNTPDSPYPWLRVVGVVGDVKRTDLIQPARPEMYVHVSQGGYTSLATSRLVVRVADGLDPTAATSMVRSAVAAMDPDVPVEGVRPMTALLDDATSRVRFTARLVMGFSVLSLLITALGLYSVIAWAAATRRRELALRVALGASSGRVMGSVLGETLAALVVGLALGGVGVYLTSGLLRGIVTGVAPLEPLSLLTAAAVLCGTALLAVQGPARASLRLDPARLLSED